MKATRSSTCVSTLYALGGCPDGCAILMERETRMKTNSLFRFAALLAVIALAVPAFAKQKDVASA